MEGGGGGILVNPNAFLNGGDRNIYFLVKMKFTVLLKSKLPPPHKMRISFHHYRVF